MFTVHLMCNREFAITHSTIYAYYETRKYYVLQSQIYYKTYSVFFWFHSNLIVIKRDVGHFVRSYRKNEKRGQFVLFQVIRNKM